MPMEPGPRRRLAIEHSRSPEYRSVRMTQCLYSFWRLTLCHHFGSERASAEPVKGDKSRARFGESWLPDACTASVCRCVWAVIELMQKWQAARGLLATKTLPLSQLRTALLLSALAGTTAL